MHRRRRFTPFFTRPLEWAAALCLAAAATLAGAAEYLPNAALAARLKALAQGRDKLVHLRSLTRTAQTNEVWLVELGFGSEEERARRPAMLLVAGIEANDLAGSACALAWLEQLVAGSETNAVTRKLLETTTLYLLPRVNPDGASRFFGRPRAESPANFTPVDEDHDGLVDEDGSDDLDGNGLITALRVPDPEGEFISDPAEPRLLLKADRAKGQAGAWRLLSEGRDDDGDQAWNEDGPGGVNFNRNFPFGYRFFAPDAGRHQVSEPETRALADFVVAHPHIGLVFTFGAADNLTAPPKAEPPKKPPGAIHEEDLGWFRELGRLWREALGLKKELPGRAEPGTFSDWMYFHRGRLSLAARPWSPAMQLELARAATQNAEQKPKTDAPQARAEGKPEAEPKAELPPGKPAAPAPAAKGAEPEKAEAAAEEERAFLKWAEQHAPELFVPWTALDHPDFPGKRVEVGGWAPFAKTNPPEKLLAPWVGRQTAFLTALAGKLPRVGVRTVKVKPLGQGLYDLTVQVENTGYLPTALAQGELTRAVAPTRVSLLGVDDKAILAGPRRAMLGPIPGSGGMKEVRWVLLAGDRATVEVEVVSMLGGTVRQTMALKAGNQP